MKQMSTKEAATYLGVSVSFLVKKRGGRKNWSPGNKGPRYTSPNGYNIWYRQDWLDEWKESIWANS